MNKKPSGAENRKRAGKKLLEEETVLKKVPTIKNFFNIVPEPESFISVKSSTDSNEKSSYSGSDVPSIVELELSNDIRFGQNLNASLAKTNEFVKGPLKTQGEQYYKDECVISQPSTSNSVGPVFLNTTDCSAKCNDPLFLIEDPATWNVKDESVIQKVIQSDIKQNLQADFSMSERQYKDAKRSLSVKLFSCTLPNGDTFKRDWLRYSSSKGCLFCVPCLLFQPESKYTSFSKGFNDWKHAFELIKQHEQSADHRKNVFTVISRKKNTTVDCLVLSQHEHEVKYWRDVLTRVVTVIRFLAVRGLPFRGSDQKLGSLSNGLFLGCLELISQFDPFIAQHLSKYGNQGKGNTSYMSADICDEFIKSMGGLVFKQILKEVSDARYFSIIVDSTPDVSNIDQLAFVLRYVSLSDACPKERLIALLPAVSHKAEDLEETVMDLLEELKLKVENCRGQSYDNASNMSGKYTGLQTRIKAKNHLADYVPCSAHSLNLVGCYAAEKSCSEVTFFFSFVQRVYTFFSASTYRWCLLKDSIKHNNEEKERGETKTTMLKSLSETRWSARADALRSIVSGYKEIEGVLETLMQDTSQTPETRLTAQGLHKKFGQLETGLLALFWNDILQRIDKTSNNLQKEELDLLDATKELETLERFLESKRDSFDEYEKKALTLTSLQEANYQRNRKRTVFADEKMSMQTEADADPRNKFRTSVFLKIVDNLTVQLNQRRESYSSLGTRFEVFRNLHDKEPRNITVEAKKLAQSYNQDLDQDAFVNECLHFQAYMKLEKIKGLRECYVYIKSNGLESTFPNLEISLRIYLTIPVTSCSAERGFSALKRIKNEKRSTLGEEKLNNLMLLCTASDITLKIDFNNLIDDFARSKQRKKALL